MGIVQVEQNRLRQKEIEVKALVALAKYGVQVQKFEALKHLEFIAYPDKVAKKINRELSEYEWFVKGANSGYLKTVDLEPEVIVDIVNRH